MLARWVLDNNGIEGHRVLDPDDRELADLLVQAASGKAEVTAAIDTARAIRAACASLI